jgi:hypothetical protein
MHALRIPLSHAELQSAVQNLMVDDLKSFEVGRNAVLDCDFHGDRVSRHFEYTARNSPLAIVYPLL